MAIIKAAGRLCILAFAGALLARVLWELAMFGWRLIP